MRLESIGVGDFDEVFQIMEASFPEDELRPREEQRALMDEDFYTIFVERSEAGAIAGFLAVWRFDDFLYVDHFAVNPRLRGGGIGSRMIGALKELSDDPICLEVELPETRDAQRRIAFYERNGFSLCEGDYTQPPISAGRRALPMRLMTSVPVDNARFEQIVSVLYSKVYGISGL
ncbi:MAG: GNAT family N-acetyltransferase [Eggerthellaceae bacterium]